MSVRIRSRSRHICSAVMITSCNVRTHRIRHRRMLNIRSRTRVIIARIMSVRHNRIIGGSVRCRIISMCCMVANLLG